jgi:hypothetical protein
MVEEFKQHPGYPQTEDEQEDFILSKAWAFQKSRVTCPTTDVDRDCLALLEERMFEDSNRAGVAGNWQWGLDSGPHQDGWNPYIGLPSHWSVGDRIVDEGELEVRGIHRNLMHRIPCGFLTFLP